MSDTKSPRPSSSAEGSVDQKPAPEQALAIIDPNASSLRRAIVLVIVCLALFIDSFNTGGMIVCLNDIETTLHQDPSIVQWVLTAFNLTFGAFLLLAGRISDIYHPKPVFILGFFIVGVFGIGAGFVNNIIGLIIIRAIQGMGASMTIPSAISMLTSAYTDPESRGIALTFFASAGTLGLCLGFVIGGVIVQFASWRWVFWGIACVSVPLSLASIWIIPVPSLRIKAGDKKMDYPGVFGLTASIILLIFAFSQAPIVGWGTARVLAPLIIALLVLTVFFVWQTRLSDEHALIPSKMWFIPNFLILILVSFSNQIYFIGPVVLLSNYYPVQYGWSPLTIGLHFLPTGIISGIICIIFPRQILRLPPRTVLVAGQAMAGLFGILYVFAYTRERYWSFTLPAMILATAGSSVTYLVSNVGVITSVPVDKVGVGSAVFNAAQQVGSAVNVAIVTTILVETTKAQPTSDQEAYHGVSSAMWWVVAIGCAEAVASAIFFKPRKSSLEGDGSGATGAEAGAGEKEGVAAV